MELCVGPSLPTLYRAYKEVGIECFGNDIDPFWRREYVNNFTFGDALDIPLHHYDTAVFAPPLSKNFTGKREDSLRVSQVRPAYTDFLSRTDLPRRLVLVLPGRSLSTRQDRDDFYCLLKHIKGSYEVDCDSLLDEKKKVVKYIDLYLER